MEYIAESELPRQEDALSQEQFARVLDNHQLLKEVLPENVDGRELFEAVADSEVCNDESVVIDEKVSLVCLNVFFPKTLSRTKWWTSGSS